MRTLLLSLGFLSALEMALAQTPNGGQQFESRCSRCHGGDATGGETGPNIVSQVGARNDADLAAFLRAGKPASGMPAFDLPNPEMTSLVAYLRSLIPISRTAPPVVVRRTVKTTDGKTVEGQVIGEGMLD